MLTSLERPSIACTRTDIGKMTESPFYEKMRCGICNGAVVAEYASVVEWAGRVSFRVDEDGGAATDFFDDGNGFAIGCSNDYAIGTPICKFADIVPRSAGTVKSNLDLRMGRCIVQDAARHLSRGFLIRIHVCKNSELFFYRLLHLSSL